MKKAISLIPLLFLLFSCNRQNESSNIPSDSATKDTENKFTEIATDNTSITTINKSALVINYIFEDGTFISREEKKIEPGKEYSFPVTLQIPFMSPDIEVIEGLKENKEETVYVTYHFNDNEVQSIKPSTTYTSFMVNQDYGLSFSFLLTESSANQKLFSGTDFSITTNSISYLNKSISYQNAFLEHPYENSLILPKNEQAIFTISLSKDKAAFYKNGHRSFTIFNNMTNGSDKPTYNTVYTNILSNIKRDGLFVNSESIKDLVVSKAKTETDITSIASKYIITELQYLDENSDLLERHSRASKEPYSYSFTDLNLPNYEIEDKSKLSGFAQKSQIISAVLKFIGKEHTLQNNKIDMGSKTGWSDESKWLKYADNFTSDFTMKLSLTNYGSISFSQKPANGGEVCWRTALPIVYDPITKDRWVTRFDWFGWQDDINNDGKRLGSSANYNNNESYVFDYNIDIYKIYKEMDIDITYSRRGSTLSMDSIIKPKRTPYAGQRYEYHCVLYGVQSNVLSFALSAEDSIGIITSLQY